MFHSAMELADSWLAVFLSNLSLPNRMLNTPLVRPPAIRMFPSLSLKNGKLNRSAFSFVSEYTVTRAESAVLFVKNKQPVKQVHQ